MPTPLFLSPPIPTPLPEFCLKRMQEQYRLSSAERAFKDNIIQRMKGYYIKRKKEKKTRCSSRFPACSCLRLSVLSEKHISPPCCVCVYVQVPSSSENCISRRVHGIDTYELEWGGGGSKLVRTDAGPDLEKCLRGGPREKGGVGMEANASVTVAGHALAGGLSG